MPGPGLMSTVLGSTDNPISGVDLGREIKDTMNRVKQAADAATVGTLIRSVVAPDTPSKDEVDAAGKTIEIAKDITALQTEKEKLALQEAEYWRQRAKEAEEEAARRKGATREEEVGMMGAMAKIFGELLNQHTQTSNQLTNMVIELLKEQRQPQRDELRDSLVQMALQMAFQNRPDPDQEAMKRLETMRQLAEAMGYRREPAGNVINLDYVRLAHQMHMDEERVRLERERMLRQFEADQELKAQEREQKKQYAEFLSSTGRALLAAASKSGGSANAPPAPQARLIRVQCGKCQTQIAVPEGTTDYECPGCHERVYIQAPGETGNG